MVLVDLYHMQCAVTRGACGLAYPEQLLVLGVVLIRTAVAVAHTPAGAEHARSVVSHEGDL